MRLIRLSLLGLLGSLMGSVDATNYGRYTIYATKAKSQDAGEMARMWQGSAYHYDDSKGYPVFTQKGYAYPQIALNLGSALDKFGLKNGEWGFITDKHNGKESQPVPRLLMKTDAQAELPKSTTPKWEGWVEADAAEAYIKKGFQPCFHVDVGEDPEEVKAREAAELKKAVDDEVARKLAELGRTRPQKPNTYKKPDVTKPGSTGSSGGKKCLIIVLIALIFLPAILVTLFLFLCGSKADAPAVPVADKKDPVEGANAVSPV